AQIYGETQGFIKLVFSRKDARLPGAQIAGMHAAQLIAPLALALALALQQNIGHRTGDNRLPAPHAWRGHQQGRASLPALSSIALDAKEQPDDRSTENPDGTFAASARCPAHRSRAGVVQR
ncbi:hypothetical protein B1A_10315, partial [mine drainage metagenome]